SDRDGGGVLPRRPEAVELPGTASEGGRQADYALAINWRASGREPDVVDRCTTGLRPDARLADIDMRNHLRTLKLAAWLGWQLETNWASPWLFALYMIVKPVCGSLMLVCMYYAARYGTGGRVPSE